MELKHRLRILKGIPPEERDAFFEWSAKVEGKNINPLTLLATDYMNHFNEIIMLIEMLPDMPDMIEECRMWEPKSYQDHFRDSGFADKETAIEAYNHVPTKFKTPFEDNVAKIDEIIPHSLDQMAECAAREDMEGLRAKVDTTTKLLRELTGACNAIIHGEEQTMVQGEIDDLISMI